MKTVLFISHDASRTGAPIFLLRFLQWFQQNSQIPFRILVGESGALASDFEALGPVDSFEPRPTIPYKILRRLKLAAPRRARHLARLREKLSKSDIGLIYANSEVNGKTLDFLSFLDCPVICHVHGLEGTIRPFGSQNMEYVKKYTNIYITVAQVVKANLVENHRIPGEKVRVIYGFIPTSQSESLGNSDVRDNVRRELGIPAGSKLVCACGTIESRKGVDIFLQVADRVLRSCGDTLVHFVWVGGRRDLADKMIRDVGPRLRDVVHFIGPRLDVGPFYEASDVFLLPSREDAFPLVMMEAALREKPIVCFDKSGGAPEFVEDDAGFIVPDFDVDIMTQRVTELLGSPELSRRMGIAAKNKVLTRHALEVGAPKIAEVIEEELLGYGRRGRAVQPEHTL